MKLKEDKERLEQLKIDFKKNIKKVSKETSKYVGISGIIRVMWWSIFKKHRFIHFMQRVADGMWIRLAWADSKNMSNKQIWETLEKMGWTK